MINDLELIQNGNMLLDNDVILYGASGLGKEVVELLNGIDVKPVFFMDTNKEKCGQIIHGIEVKSMEYAKEYVLHHKSILIITSMYVDEINSCLEKEKFLQGKISTTYALRYSIHYLITKGKVSNRYADVYNAMFDKWKNEYLDRTRAIQLNERNGGIKDEDIFDIFAYSPIWIYQSGKVGSSTIRRSIQLLGRKWLHIHDIPYHLRFKYGEEGYNQFKEGIKKIKKKVIITVRDPLARDLSWYAFLTEFMHLGLIHDELDEDFVQSFYRYMDKYTGGKPAMMAGYTWKEYLAEKFCCGGEFDWFDYEVKELFGIDVFQEKFDKEKGYTIISKDNVEILLMQMEKINQLESVIAEFIDEKEFKIVNLNEAKEYSYNYAYNELKKKIVIPQKYIDLYYGEQSKTNHFYSTEDIEKFRKKWSR